jgi:GNAT superfamily N-acetyltransferase
VSFAIRVATEADLPAMREVMRLAIDQLQSAYLNPAEVAASAAVMGLDTQLVADRTYFVVTAPDGLAGCGGWSRRATLYGGDHSHALREPRLLDPRTDAARIRAMYTHPSHARQGVGRLILAHAEQAARAEGFTTAELMATLAGEPLYRAFGYVEAERIVADGDGVAVPLIRMVKPIA